MKTKFTILVTVFAAALFGSGCASVKITKEQLQNGLVAFYPFDGNAMDGSGNGNHGEVNGATLTKDRHGAEDNAYKFDGTDDDIRVNKLPGSFKDQITMSVWVKATNKDVSTVIRKDSLNGGRNSPNRKYDWSLQIMDAKEVNFGIATEETQVGFGARIHTRTIVEKWSHIVAVRDGASMYIHLGAEKIGEKSISGKMKSGSPSFSIGSIDNDNQFMKGLIDDVRIYNRTLSAEEVKALYDLEKPKDK